MALKCFLCTRSLYGTPLKRISRGLFYIRFTLRKIAASPLIRSIIDCGNIGYLITYLVLLAFSVGGWAPVCSQHKPCLQGDCGASRPSLKSEAVIQTSKVLAGIFERLCPHCSILLYLFCFRKENEAARTSQCGNLPSRRQLEWLPMLDSTPESTVICA